MKTPKMIAEKIVKLVSMVVLNIEDFNLNWLRPSERKVLFNGELLSTDFPRVCNVTFEFNTVSWLNPNTRTCWKARVVLLDQYRDIVGFIDHTFVRTKEQYMDPSWDLTNVAIYMAKAR
jgi:hypothetical protein